MRLPIYIMAGVLLTTIAYFFYLDEFQQMQIIIRHDKSDTEFIKIAEKFEKTICHLNLPDCEGTIIDDQWVISAAHCSIEIQEKLNAGKKHFVLIDGIEIQVDRVIIHRNWKNDKAYDIALLHLIKKPDNVIQADLYVDEDEVDNIVYLVGKGDKGNGLTGIDGNDGKLRGATNRVEEATKFWLKWTFDSPDTPTKYLTKYEGISGPGDSGGPAFIVKNDKIYIAGISSGQSTKNTGGIEGVYGVKEYYTRISQHIGWIHRKMKNYK